MTPNTTRRSLLRASPALLAPCLLATSAQTAKPDPLPAAGQAEGGDPLPQHDTPILRIFREWDELQAFWNDRTRVFDDAEANALYAQLTAIEERLLAEPVISLLDLAAKLVVGTTYGDFAPEDELVAECAALLAAGAA